MSESNPKGVIFWYVVMFLVWLGLFTVVVSYYH